VTFLNYVNPMAMNCWAINRASKIKTVGLCHSVQGTAEQMARDIGVPIEEINYLCAGINHMAFYLRFERKTPGGRAEDLYPLVRQVIEEGRVPDWNRVRYEMFKRLGYFVTESSEHFSEYTPWFIKRDRPDLIEQFNVPIDEYIRRCEVQIAGWELTKAPLRTPNVPGGQEAVRGKIRAAGGTEWDVRQTRKATNFDEISQSHEYGSLSSTAWRPARRAWCTAMCQQRHDRQPAAGLHGGSALPGG
jgi:alpha-galactosidase